MTSVEWQTFDFEDDVQRKRSVFAEKRQVTTAAKPRTTAFSRTFHSKGVATKPEMTVSKVNGSVSKASDSSLDSFEDLEYGPGFVSKLKDRYLSVALKGANSAPIRRSASLENFLQKDKEDEQIEICTNETVEKSTGIFAKNKAASKKVTHLQTRGRSRNKESMKRAQSVEVIARATPVTAKLDQEEEEAGKPPPLPPRPNVNEKRPLYKARSASALFGFRQRELPAPDIVKETRKIFEQRLQDGNRGRKLGPFDYQGVTGNGRARSASVDRVSLQDRARLQHLREVPSKPTLPPKINSRPVPRSREMSDSPTANPKPVLTGREVSSPLKVNSKPVPPNREMSNNPKINCKPVPPSRETSNNPKVNSKPVSPIKETSIYPKVNLKPTREISKSKLELLPQKDSTFQIPPLRPVKQRSMSDLVPETNTSSSRKVSENNKQIGVIKPIARRSPKEDVKFDSQVKQKNLRNENEKKLDSNATTIEEQKKSLKPIDKAVNVSNTEENKLSNADMEDDSSSQGSTSSLKTSETSDKSIEKAVDRVDNEGYRTSWKRRAEDKHTIIFNFANSERDTSHIENDGRNLNRRTKKKPAPLVLNGTGGGGDTSCSTDDASDDSDIDVHRPVSPCNVEFLNAYVKLDKSTLRETKTKKKLTISFSSTNLAEIYEYPSFEAAVQIHKEEEGLKGTGALGLKSDLGSFTPSKVQLTDNSFQLGISRIAENDTPKNPEKRENPEPESVLRPAENASAWSGTSTADMLF